MRRAAAVVVPHPDGRVLAVSRPGWPLCYGFPGGSVEPGETFEQGARRELREETGLIADHLIRLGSATHRNTVVVFFVEIGAPFGVVRSSAEGWTRWVDPRVVACIGAAWPHDARQALHAASIPMQRC